VYNVLTACFQLIEILSVFYSNVICSWLLLCRHVVKRNISVKHDSIWFWLSSKERSLRNKWHFWKIKSSHEATLYTSLSPSFTFSGAKGEKNVLIRSMSKIRFTIPFNLPKHFYTGAATVLPRPFYSMSPSHMNCYKFLVHITSLIIILITIPLPFQSHAYKSSLGRKRITNSSRKWKKGVSSECG